jgi:hypothetical protein
MAFTMSLSTADRGQLWLIILMGVWLTAVSPPCRCPPLTAVSCG